MSQLQTSQSKLNTTDDTKRCPEPVRYHSSWLFAGIQAGNMTE
jgi:hypothetical protein